MHKIRRLVMLAAAALSIAAVVQEVRRPKGERTWHGQILGVPYDFRLPTVERARERWWNAQAGLFTPKLFGLGWEINFYRLSHRGG